jgi:hypothetical protein
MATIKPQVEFVFNLRGVPPEVDFREDYSMTSNLGTYIKSRIRELGKTQGWVAESLGVSNNAVSKWIKSGKIGRENFFSLVALLGSENAPFIGDLIESESPKPANVTILPAHDLYMRTLKSIADSMSDEGRSQLLGMAKLLAAQYPAQANMQNSSH